MIQTYTIRVDNEDHEFAPDKPWTVTLVTDYRLEGEDEFDATGIGATPAEALADFAREWGYELSKNACRDATDHLPGALHRWQDCPTYTTEG